jgi:hypothetical protein
MNGQDCTPAEFVNLLIPESKVVILSAACDLNIQKPRKTVDFELGTDCTYVYEVSPFFV